MRNVDRSALVPYTAPQMFSLVADIEAYPEFLPWCTGAEIHSRTESLVEASMEMRRGGIRKVFRTRNLLQRDESMRMQLQSGPFSDLSGEWLFSPLGTDGTKVALTMAFEFENALLDSLLGRYFEETCNSLIDSFIKRAHSIYDETDNQR